MQKIESEKIKESILKHEIDNNLLKDKILVYIDESIN